MKNKKLNSGANYWSKFLVLMSAFFSGKGVFTKIGFILVILFLFIPNAAISAVFAVLVFIFVGILAIMNDKDVKKVAKTSNKGVVSFAKEAVGGDIGANIVKSVVDKGVSTFGGDLEVELREQKLNLAEMADITKFFNLLDLKKKAKLKLVKSSGAKLVLKGYYKDHGTPMKLEAQLKKEKDDKAALKKAARKAAKNAPVYGPVVPPVNP